MYWIGIHLGHHFSSGLAEMLKVGEERENDYIFIFKKRQHFMKVILNLKQTLSCINFTY